MARSLGCGDDQPGRRAGGAIRTFDDGRLLALNAADGSARPRHPGLLRRRPPPRLVACHHRVRRQHPAPGRPDRLQAASRGCWAGSGSNRARCAPRCRVCAATAGWTACARGRNSFHRLSAGGLARFAPATERIYAPPARGPDPGMDAGAGRGRRAAARRGALAASGRSAGWRRGLRGHRASGNPRPGDARGAAGPGPSRRAGGAAGRYRRARRLVACPAGRGRRPHPAHPPLAPAGPALARDPRRPSAGSPRPARSPRRGRPALRRAQSRHRSVVRHAAGDLPALPPPGAAWAARFGGTTRA